MKTIRNFLGLALTATILLASCSKSDDNDANNENLPTEEQFNAIQDQALADRVQEFQLDANNGSTTLTSEQGVEITINGNCLNENGNAVNGMVDIEFVELFDKGSMLITNKPTMGIMPNGDKAMLISGGEFFIKATQNGAELNLSCQIQLKVPANLTGGGDNQMTLWSGVIDADGELAWREDQEGANGQGGAFLEGGVYYAFLNQFGWSNVDRFYNDPRPKTTILVAPPTGYDNTNSAIYLSYDGEDTGLANLDTYTNDGLFSEHYGQIPVGLECHVIFISEENGNWKYAIKAVTITANETITIDITDTVVGTENQLVTAINGLP